MKKLKPRVSILSPEFTYRNAASTDVKKTWAEARKRAAQNVETVTKVVTPIRKVSK